MVHIRTDDKTFIGSASLSSVKDFNSPTSAKHKARLMRNFEVAKAQVDRDLANFKADVEQQQLSAQPPSRPMAQRYNVASAPISILSHDHARPTPTQVDGAV